MKFKDKDGTVLEDLKRAHLEFCAGRHCKDCVLNQDPTNDCVDLRLNNPAEAARLMGYEVVEDAANDEQMTNKLKEANMDKQKPVAENTAMKEAQALETQGFSVAKKQKPRICEVLGVEVGQTFTAKTPFGNFNRCVISEDGMVLNTGTNILCYIINHPESITRPHRFTEEEAAFLTHLYKCGVREVEKSSNPRDNVAVYGEKERRDCGHVRRVWMLPYSCLPSLLPEQRVELSDIIGDAD